MEGGGKLINNRHSNTVQVKGFCLTLFGQGVFKMRDYLLSLAGGLIVGILFSLVKLPLPAPPLVGIFGMVGIFLGGVLMDSLFKSLKEKRKVST